jgi:hypothetical protein
MTDNGISTHVRLRRDRDRVRQLESWRAKDDITDSELRELVGPRRRIKWLEARMGSAQEEAPKQVA